MSAILHAQAIAGRLSLRAPQREALEILARVCERIELSKEQDLDDALLAVQAERPEFAGFDDRSFPSLCFALATGVGKTRLMGAFVAWLHRAHGINDFLVLAPNLTIYQKLIADFTPNTPKYVFEGVSEFATDPPLLITGDDFETGRGVRKGQLFDSGVHVNIFNISKINSEMRGDHKPRVKMLIETIGEAYFDYLAGLDRLVLIMDESHRYRATAGVRAINDLRPILGLELTATPQVESGGRPPRPFGNVVYSYPLANAIADGFVKEPAVATRQDFDRKSFDEARLERLKLEDGVRIHESTKVDLEVYARNHGARRVKPFVLVVARDTEHAGELQRAIEAEDFFGGRYGGKVLTVHSKQTGDERDENVQQLLTVEDPANPIEVVIHVNMLKEGWDVTNLFTIVPLRTADSKTLVEQSIGRGLRLPYGKRTGVDAVDRLTIVAHDRFREIVDYANDPSSAIRRMAVFYVDRDLDAGQASIVEVQPSIVRRLLGSGAPAEGVGRDGQRPLFDSARKQEIGRLVIEALPEFERLPSSRDLLAPEVQERIVDQVRRSLPPAQEDFTQEPIDLASLVRETVEAYVELSIDIPRVLVQPKSEVHGRYRTFQLDLRAVQLQPVTKDILIRHLQENRQYLLVSGDGVIPEARSEDYVVRGLMNFDDVSYDENAGVLYALAEQVALHLRSYLPLEEDVSNVLQYHQHPLAEVVHAQMQEHYEEPGVEYEVVVKAGFRTLGPSNHRLASTERIRGFREPVEELQRIPQMLFGGFRKSLYPEQRFQSDPERRFAEVLESDESVLKWLKPQERDVLISRRDGGSYLPDFVVETREAKFLCEVKASGRLDDLDVLEKARAGSRWCAGATEHARQHGGKPWAYLLVPDDQIGPQRSFNGLAEAHRFAPEGCSAAIGRGSNP